jgi:hypothetical protein
VIKTNWEAVKDWWTGGTEEVKAFKQELSAFKLVDMLKNKPPGALAAAELEVLEKGVPGDDASAEVIANYLRAGKARIDSNYAYNRMKLKWIDKFGDINETQREGETILGAPVEAGMNFDDFVESLGESIREYAPVKTDAPPSEDVTFQRQKPNPQVGGDRNRNRPKLTSKQVDAKLDQLLNTK